MSAVCEFIETDENVWVRCNDCFWIWGRDNWEPPKKCPTCESRQSFSLRGSPEELA